MNKINFGLIVILISVFCRIIPHPPNFTPVLALAIVSSMQFGVKYSSLLTISSMILSDFIIGGHGLIIPVYVSMLISCILGSFCTNKINMIMLTLCGSVQFFVITNFFVWLSYDSLNYETFIQCYVLAIPFFKNAIIGDIGFVIFFGTLLHIVKLYESKTVVKNMLT